MIKKPQKLTIKDIARLANVSPTAVSFVLNGKDGVSTATREKVHAVIAATNYRPNPSSLRLSYRKSFNIALVYPPSASPFADLYYYEIARGLTDQLSAAGYNVVFAKMQSTGKDHNLPRILASNDADGIILLQDMDPASLSRIESLDIPFVMVDIHKPDLVHTHVSVDSEKSINAVVQYLINQGHTKIAFLGSDWLPGYYLQCLAGYQSALATNGLPIQAGWLQKSANSQVETAVCISRLLKCTEKPTAICCMGDAYAVDAIKFIKESGLSVPKDISIISIDDILLSQYIDPPLTTVRYDKEEMGQIAARLLLDKMAGKPVESVIVNSECIVERQSVRALR